MSINDNGFLSPDIQLWIKKHRGENIGWFKLAEDLNIIGQKQLHLLKIPENSEKLFLVAMLFIRGLSGFQGAILLTERGMTTEARTLCRGCLETAFYIGALIKDQEFVTSMINDDTNRRRKLANGLLHLEENRASLDDNHREHLEKFINGLEQNNFKPENIQIESAARKSGLLDIYTVFYRSLSNDSAHPSVSSLTRHIRFDGEQLVDSKLPWGPNVKDIEDTISTACTGMVHLIYLIMEILDEGDNAPISDQINACWDLYKQLIGDIELRSDGNV